MRFYGFAAERADDGGCSRDLDLAMDPKLAWALRHREFFPVDVNRASKADVVAGAGDWGAERGADFAGAAAADDSAGGSGEAEGEFGRRSPL